MKHLFKLVALFLLVLSSCKAPAPKSYVQYLDYTEFPEVYISEAPTAPFNYKPLGSISALITSGKLKKSSISSARSIDDIYGHDDEVKVGPSSAKTAGWFVPTIDNALEYLVLRCKEAGGDMILSLKFQRHEDKNRDVYIEVSAMIAKREY